MRVLGKVLSIFSAFLLFAAFIAPSALADVSDSGSLRILFTHDLHASLEPAEVADENGGFSETGGFARLAAAIREARADSPESTLLVDAGDYSVGTLYQALETTQSPELRLMGMMGYDAVTVGNHEFDCTITGFADSLNAAAGSGDPLPAYVMSNISLPGEGDAKTEALRAAMDACGVAEYTVVEKKRLPHRHIRRAGRGGARGRAHVGPGRV